MTSYVIKSKSFYEKQHLNTHLLQNYLDLIILINLIEKVHLDDLCVN